MWLEVGTTNNDSRVVAKYFLDRVKQIGGMPSIVHADYGTENVKQQHIKSQLSIVLTVAWFKRVWKYSSGFLQFF